MPEYKCGKTDRCRYNENCPYNHFPLANYLCFDNKRKWALEAYEQRKKNKPKNK